MDKKMKMPQLGDTIYYVCDEQLTIRGHDIKSMTGWIVLHDDPHYKEYISKGFKFRTIELGFGNNWNKTPTLYANRENGDYRFTPSGWGSRLFFTIDESHDRLRELKDKKIQKLEKEIDTLK